MAGARYLLQLLRLVPGLEVRGSLRAKPKGTAIWQGFYLRHVALCPEQRERGKKGGREGGGKRGERVNKERGAASSGKSTERECEMRKRHLSPARAHVACSGMLSALAMRTNVLVYASSSDTRTSAVQGGQGGTGKGAHEKRRVDVSERVRHHASQSQHAARRNKPHACHSARPLSRPPSPCG